MLQVAALQLVELPVSYQFYAVAIVMLSRPSVMHASAAFAGA